MYIDDCVNGIDMIMHCDDLIATPINLGTSELVTVNELVSKVEKIARVKLKREYDPTAPGVWPAATATTLSSRRCSTGSPTPRSTRVCGPLTGGSRCSITPGRRASGWWIRRLCVRRAAGIGLQTQDAHKEARKD